MLFLEVDKGIEQPLPLCKRWVGVFDPAVLQQVTNLSSREPSFRIGQDATDRFQVLGMNEATKTKFLASMATAITPTLKR